MLTRKGEVSYGLDDRLFTGPDGMDVMKTVRAGKCELLLQDSRPCQHCQNVRAHFRATVSRFNKKQKLSSQQQPTPHAATAPDEVL